MPSLLNLRQRASWCGLIGMLWSDVRVAEKANCKNKRRRGWTTRFLVHFWQPISAKRQRCYVPVYRRFPGTISETQTTLPNPTCLYSCVTTPRAVSRTGIIANAQGFLTMSSYHQSHEHGVTWEFLNWTGPIFSKGESSMRNPESVGGMKCRILHLLQGSSQRVTVHLATT